MSTLKKMRGEYLMVMLAMCGLISSALGILINVAGIFMTPLAEELGTSTAAVNLTLTISNLAFAVAGLFSARLVRPKNFRPAIIVCTLIFAGATALLAICHDLTSLYLCNAVRGLTAGLIGSVLVTTVLGRWFLADTGFITSLAMGCSGLAGALFNPVLEAVIRAAGWRTAYLVAAGIILLLNLPAMVLPVSYLPEDAGLEALGAGAGGEASGVNPQRRQGDASGPLTMGLILIVFAFSGLVSAIPQLFRPLAGTYGLAETGVAMMSAALVMNTGGKFLLGILTDRIGVRRSCVMYELVIAAGILLLLLVRVPAAMLAGAVMTGLCYSVPTIGAVMICRELFSADRYSEVYPKIALGVTIANAFGYPLLGAFYDRSGSYDGALILIIALALSCVAGILVIYRLAGKKQAQG